MTNSTQTGKNRLNSTFSRAYERFVKIRGHPREIALGLALGLFIAMSPFMGLHTAIALCLAALFKWNKISAAIGVWLSNPATAPVIYSMTWFVGSKITGITLAENLPQVFSFKATFQLLYKTPAILSTLTIGGIVVGIPVAIVGYYIAFGVIQKYQEGVREKLKKRKARRKKKKKSRKKNKRKR